MTDVVDGFVRPFMEGTRKQAAFFTLLDYSVLSGESRTHRAAVTRSRFCVTVRDYWHGVDRPVTSRRFTLRPARTALRVARDLQDQGWVRLDGTHGNSGEDR